MIAIGFWTPLQVAVGAYVFDVAGSRSNQLDPSAAFTNASCAFAAVHAPALTPSPAAALTSLLSSISISIVAASNLTAALQVGQDGNQARALVSEGAEGSCTGAECNAQELHWMWVPELDPAEVYALVQLTGNTRRAQQDVQVYTYAQPLSAGGWVDCACWSDGRWQRLTTH